MPPTPNCNVRNSRMSVYAASMSSYEVAECPEVPHMPEAVMEDEDEVMSGADSYRMSIGVSRDGDQVPLYFGNPEAQRRILTAEHAALRLEQEKPHLYAALAARHRLGHAVKTTDLLDGAEMFRGTEATVWLKSENLQHSGSFKIRGAFNAINLRAGERQHCPVATMSTGNHGQGVARAARAARVGSFIFMPVWTSLIKVNAAREQGAEVELVGESLEQTRTAYEDFLAKNTDVDGIHPYAHPDVATGQSSIAAELMDQVPELTSAYFSIGGGGLIARNAAALKEYNPEIKVVGVQLLGSDSARLSMEKGKIVPIDHPEMFSDATALGQPAESNFEYMQRYVDHVVSVDRVQLASAMLDYERKYRHTIEPAGALVLAAIEAEKSRLGGVVVGIVSGGNRSEDTCRRAESIVERQAA